MTFKNQCSLLFRGARSHLPDRIASLREQVYMLRPAQPAVGVPMTAYGGNVAELIK